MTNQTDLKQPSGRGHRVLAGAVCLALVVVGPEIVYRIAMREIRETPKRVEPVSAGEMEATWIGVDVKDGVPNLHRALPKLRPLYPWEFWRLAKRDWMGPGLEGAALVAEVHLLTLEGRGALGGASGFHNQLRKAAVTIWLSRHWTIEEVSAFSYRTYALPAPASKEPTRR